VNRALAAMSIDERNGLAAGWANANLLAYAVGLWPGYKVGRHHAALAERLAAVERGEIRRLMVFMPPRHGKSLLASEDFPAWYLGRHPDRYLMSASYSAELALDFGRAVRENVRSPLHQAAFPTCRLADDSKAADHFSLTAGGEYYSIGVGGSATGRGAHLLVVDDPTKGRAEAESEAHRRALKAWYRSVARTRLMPGGAIVFVMTRWHDDDLAGWQLREFPEEGWTVLNLPALAEDDDPLGRAPGEALWPEMFPREDLLKTAHVLGAYDFSALYQGSPVPVEGGIFKRTWPIGRYGTPPASPARIVQSWDTAQKERERNDPSVCTTWAETPLGYYLLHAWRERVVYPDLKRAAKSLAARWRPDAVLIEDKGSGTSLLQDLRVETRIPVIAVEPIADKVIRAMAISPMFEAGRVFLPDQAEWLPEYEAELFSFPGAKHDDQVDSTSQALRWMSAAGAASGGACVVAESPRKGSFNPFSDRRGRLG